MQLANKRFRIFLVLGVLCIAASLILVASPLGEKLINYTSERMKPVMHKLFADEATIAVDQLKKTNESKINLIDSYFFGFEEMPADMVTDKYVHSGKYAAAVIGKNSYSPSFEITSKHLDLSTIKHIGISCWIYIESTKEVPSYSLTCAIEDEKNNSYIWRGFGVNKREIGQKKWIKISGEVKLEEQPLNNKHTIKIYFWNNSNANIYVDDILVVLSKKTDRQGKDFACDLTKGEYKQLVNKPPYPTLFLSKENSNGSTAKSIAPGNQDMGNCKFIMQQKATDAILCIGNNSISAYQRKGDGSYAYQAVQGTMPTTFFQATYMLGGSFSALGVAEIISVTRGVKTNVQLTKYAKNSLNMMSSSVLPHADINGCIASDLNNDGITELLLTTPDGGYAIYNFANGQWNQVAKGSISSWSKKMNFCAGRFLTKEKIALLAIHQDQSQTALYTFNVSSKQLEKVRMPAFFSGKHDTLQVADTYMAVDLNGDQKDELLLYKNSWRYELKLIDIFSTGALIRGNIDFMGYEQDYNPKYYEYLKLAPLKLSGNKQGLLTVMRNCKKDSEGNNCTSFEERSDIPSATSIYSLK